MEPLLAAKIGTAVSLALLSLVLTTFLLRKLVDLIIIGLWLGAIVIAGVLVYLEAATAWEQVITESVSLGFLAGLASTFLIPLSSKGFEKTKDTVQKPRMSEETSTEEKTVLLESTTN